MSETEPDRQIVPIWNDRIHHKLQDRLLTPQNAELQVQSDRRFKWTPIDDIEAARMFLSAKKGSASTERRYSREIYRFFLWMHHINDASISNIDPEAIQDYVKFCIKPPSDWCGSTGGVTSITSPQWRPFKSRLDENKSGKSTYKPSVDSIINIIAILKSFFSFLVDVGYLQGDPTKILDGDYRAKILIADAAKAQHESTDDEQTDDKEPTKPGSFCRLPTEPKGFNQIQWKCLLETIENMPFKSKAQKLKYHRAKLVVNLLYWAGLRSDEARSHLQSAITYDEIRDGLILTVYGKGSKKRTIPLHPNFESILIEYRLFHGLSAYPDENDKTPLFPSYHLIHPTTLSPTKAMSERGAEEWIKNLYKKAEKRMEKKYQNEMPKTAIKFSDATLHTIRHTRARHMLYNDGIELRLVQAFLGHSKILTTQTYTEPNLDQLFAVTR